MQIPVIFIAFANDKVDYARYLRNLPKEQDGIRKALFEAQQAGLCEVIERANATLEQLLDVFQNKNYKDRIAVFHYGGHADGYQLLLEQLDGSHSVAHGGGLVSFFAKQNGLKLVFFNGCSTQQQALELSAAGVPAVIGTSQSINDDVATALSIRFYKGLGQGHSLERAWNEALDEIELQYGDQNKKLYRLKKGEEAPDQLPWNLIVREGSEVVKAWNLPEAVDNPLFGLPEIPRKFNLPDPPFLFLRRYERPHAEIFFGRSFYIRELYNRITDSNAAPVILLYGQSGVGKSSLLDAGLLPRLEGTYEVRYMRRIRDLGLLGSLYFAVQDAWENAGENAPTNELVRHEDRLVSAQKAQKIRQLQSLAQDLDPDLQGEVFNLIKKLEEKQVPENQALGTQEKKIVAVDHPKGSLQEYWQILENRFEKPLVLILDQVEEMLTQPNEKIKDEFEQLLEELKKLFGDPSFLPKGKIILSYRKEYHPEVEEGFKTFGIPRERVFLKHLSRKDIIEVVQGLTLTERLRKQYHLEVDQNLPVIIADDLLEDRDSSIAPVLQILLTKMWQRVEKDETPQFTIDLYQKLKGEGILMNDFFYQQIEKLREWNAEIETSGLALAVLNFHTTPIGTSRTVSAEDLHTRYSHLQEHLPALLMKFKELYLLTDGANNSTSLGHDTLAPLVAREFQRSDRRGQRAARIIISKAVDFEKDEKNLIDPADLTAVENGLTGMRVLNPTEEKLLFLSKKRRDRLRIIRKAVRAGFIFAFFVIVGISILAVWQGQIAKEERQIADIERIKANVAFHEAEKSAIIAQEKEKEAVASEQVAKVQKAKADTAAIRAKQSAEIATMRQIEAEIAKEEALKSEKKAVESKIYAEQQGEAARISTIDAEIARFVSDMNSEEANYSKYRAKAKELAVQSISINEFPDLKIILALNAYQLNDYAYIRLEREMTKIWRSYENYLNNQVRNEEKGYARASSRMLRLTYERLKNTTKERNTESQIFEALRKAYIRNNPKQQDFLFEAESWELQTLVSEKIMFNSKKGEIIMTSLNSLSPNILPMPAEINNLTPNQIFQYNSITETPQGVYVGGKNGQIKFFNRGTIAEVQTIGSYPSTILSMLYVNSFETLAFSHTNHIVLQNLNLNTKQEFTVDAKAVRHLTLMEQDQHTYLLASDNYGKIWYMDMKKTDQGFQKINLDLGNHGIQTMFFFKSAKMLLAGNSRGEVFAISNFAVENIEKGENMLINRFFWHRGMVKEVALSPDKRFFATAGFDGTVQMWRVRGNDWIKHLKKQPDLFIQEPTKILGLTFDAKSEYLLFNDEQKLRICPTNPLEFYKKLCLQKTRELTPDEWTVYMGDIKPSECVICK